MDRTKTIGQIATSLQKKAVDNTHSAHEQMQESLTDWDKNIHECVDHHKKIFTGDFYVVVITKKEKLFDNVFRNFYLARLSCPTPIFDQTVYRYTRKSNKIEFMWIIPSKETCIYMKEHMLELDPEEYQLLNYVMQFYDGTLDKVCKHLNDEKEDTGQLILN